MRILLGLVLALSLVGCASKKKTPQSPASPAARESKGDKDKDKDGDGDMKSSSTPDDPDDDKPIDKSDPQEGGE